MNQIIQLKAEIELEAKWAVRHEAMNRTAMAEAAKLRVENMRKRLERLENEAAR